MTPARAVALTLLVLGILCPKPLLAFDYLEHSFFTDYACHKVQAKLSAHLSSLSKHDPLAPKLARRLLTLALFCPLEWDTPYCREGYKQSKGQINATQDIPEVDRAFSITLGDYAALPDHTARFGPIRSLTRAREPEGVLWYTMTWLAQDSGGPGGFVEDVAEDACETDDLVPWAVVKADIDIYLAESQDAPGAIPESMLTPLAREEVPRGPSDPAGAYAFDHPHYLDLVLRNHNHFGVQAFSSWLGFHSAGVQLARRRCDELLALDAGMLKHLSQGRPPFATVPWDGLPQDALITQGCALLRHILHQKVRRWFREAPKALSAPLRPLVMSLELADPDQRDLLLDQLVTSLMGLVFEAGGLHFLQDGLASGHMRTIRLRGGLQTSRYDHDRDNAEGVVAIYSTRTGSYPFVAFGDSFLLGPALMFSRECLVAPGEILTDSRRVTTCLIQHQRGLMTAATMASLMDWALGGTLYNIPPQEASEALCQGKDPIKRFICTHLPNQPTFVAGEEGPEGFTRTMHHGALPVPPPPFSYESLSTRLGFDLEGRSPQAGIHLKLYSELGALATWLISYRGGVSAAIGEADERQWFADAGYGFHFRWAARFTVDLEASLFAGFQNFEIDTTFFAGLAPQAGLSLRPEGWTKLPLEIELRYRLPFNVFTSKSGFFDQDLLGGHWIHIGLGLAFM